MHLSTEKPAASRMLEPFGEVGGDVPEYFSSRTHLAKIEDKKLLRKIRSKNLTASFHNLVLKQYEVLTEIRIPLKSLLEDARIVALSIKSHEQTQ